MDFEFHFTREHEKFRQEVRAFLEENALKEPVVPWSRWNVSAEIYRKGREVERKLGAKGWFAPRYPKEYGGGGLDIEHSLILDEEITRITDEHRWPAGSVSSFSPPALMNFGTEEQRQRFLPSLLRGEWEEWHLYTEPDAGTDEANMKTTAIRDGDTYIINGDKIFVGSHPLTPDILFLAAVTDPRAPRYRNLSTILVPPDLPGITYRPLDFYITHIGPKWQISFEDVRCPADGLVGVEKEGWSIVRGTGGYGSIPTTPLFTVVLKLIDYCKRTRRNGQPISSDPHIQDILVQLYTGYQVERLWGLRDFAMSQGQIPRVPYVRTLSTYHQKLFRPALGWSLLDVLGAYALIDDPELLTLAKEVEYFLRGTVLNHMGGAVAGTQIILSRGLGLGRQMARDPVTTRR